jgi:asparagine N-glycosylation enzyme membrane subunit Stt3
VRVANAPVAFADGVPQVPLLDDLYHFKRIAFTASHFPRVLDFDPDRGERGEFCPWPPLYDFACAALARLAGARTAGEVLSRVVWLAPLFTALFVAVSAAIVARRYGAASGAALAVALALSPFSIAESSIGNLDYHFLEPALLFAVAAATALAVRRSSWIEGSALGVALTVAIFVRTSFLITAAISFALLFAMTDGLAAAIGFGIAAVAVALYRVSRPLGYPDQQWFLGWSHAALLGAAAVAAAMLFWRGRSLAARLVAIACGAAVVFATPSAPASILFGSEYVGGNPWFRTISEGRAVWSGGPEDGWRVALLMAGAVCVILVARRSAVLAAFGAAFLLLTLPNVRFSSASLPLLALAGVVAASRFEPRRRLAVLAIVVVPVAAHFAVWHARPWTPVVGPRELPWMRSALFLRDQPAPGRVLAPWSIGHLIDVVGQRPVIIDNFGIMSDEDAFNRAHDAYLALDEAQLLRYCRHADVRFVVLDNPLYGLQSAAAVLGIDPRRYVPTDERGTPAGATRLAESTWWWRAYYRRGPFRHFRLLYADPQPSWQGTAMFRGPAIMIWERFD